MSRPDPGLRPRRRFGLATREIGDGELVVVTASGERAFVLNALGSAVWHLAGGDLRLAEIAAIVVEHFDGVDAAEVERDVGALLEALLEADLIELIH